MTAPREHAADEVRAGSVQADGVRATGTVLDRIVADRRERLVEDRRARPEAALAELAATLAGPPIDFGARLRTGTPSSPPGARLRLVAEIKRASPSKGVLNPDLDPVAQAAEYATAGAAAISVLTEPSFFHGTVAELRAVRDSFGARADRPALLRKDFLFDAYQVLEARAHGADALLLIVAMLEPTALRDLLALTTEQGLAALVEVHDAAELDTALAAGARIIGINNRNLHTFEEDLGTTERLAPLLASSGATLVAESAIHAAADAVRMAEAGAHAILVGEALVRAGNIGAKARELMLVDVPAKAGGW